MDGQKQNANTIRTRTSELDRDDLEVAQTLARRGYLDNVPGVVERTRLADGEESLLVLSPFKDEAEFASFREGREDLPEWIREAKSFEVFKSDLDDIDALIAWLASYDKLEGFLRAYQGIIAAQPRPQQP